VSALAIAVSAGALWAAALPVVPIDAQYQIKQHAPARFRYVPTWMASGYRYYAWTSGRTGLDIRFLRGTPGTIPHSEIGFAVTRLKCSALRSQRRFRIHGRTVYWSATKQDQQAWTCFPNRVLVDVTATTLGGGAKATPAAVARVAASARKL
jgi:hypothetical protein